MKPRRNLRSEILHALAQGTIVSLYKFSMDAGYFDYSYCLQVFRQLEREGRILMITRSDLQGQPWEVLKGPHYSTPVQPAYQDQLPIGEL